MTNNDTQELLAGLLRGANINEPPISFNEPHIIIKEKRNITLSPIFSCILFCILSFFIIFASEYK